MAWNYHRFAICFMVLLQLSVAYDMLTAARCQARCLTLFLDVRGENVKPNEPSRKLSEDGRAEKVKTATSYGIICADDANCSSCVRPCDEVFSAYLACSTLCKEIATPELCFLSCSFLKNVTTYKPGRCPAISEVTGFAAACVKSCNKDGDCDSSRKCCENGCGRTCQDPVGQLEGLPDIPENLTVMERKIGTSFQLDWDVVDDLETSEPIVFVVEGKSNIGRHHSEHHMARWEYLGKTTMRTMKILKDVLPGHWYEFKVAAVNRNGTKGYSGKSKPITLSKEPEPPHVPVNLTVGETRIINGKVSLTVHWEEPVSDLPVVRYKVYWSKRLSVVSPTLVSLQEYKKAVSSDKSSYTITELLPNTPYNIQVQAFSQYGDTRLRGDRTSVDITTPPLENGGNVVTGPVLFVHPSLGAAVNVTIEVPYFQNGLLKARVTWAYPPGSRALVNKFLIHWAPGVCLGRTANGENVITKTLGGTTHEPFFDVYDLRYNCRYTVTIQPTTEDAQIGRRTSVEFHTPACGDAIIVGDITPDCPTPAPGQPSAPENVTHMIIISPDNIISATIQWDMPGQSDRPVTGYRIIYGKKPSFLDKLEIVSKEKHSITLHGLHQATDYMVKVQAVSEVGLGQLAHLEFSTPKFHSTKADDDDDIPSSTHKSYDGGGEETPEVKPQLKSRETVQVLSEMSRRNRASLSRSTSSNIVSLLISVITLMQFMMQGRS
ncbi:PREDICTED: anosmin-1-like isoform X2 [Priapulus caudatus]|uniref:Anosmin-1-like isoform X2 n=1 Tax=Priapulus caudatus TaxID=37621 RepID=A0ABM1DRG3_PRICU|nr:PREDICTED: anosmin-1-like isoform X2 [Priapulus caudatus]